MNQLAEYRKQIDKLDKQLLQIIADRISVVNKVGEYKKQQGLQTYDPVRWNAVLQKKVAAGKVLDLDSELITQIWEAIHRNSLAIQNSKRSNKKLRIGIQGGKGSFNEQAILKYVEQKDIRNYELIYLYTTQNVLASLNHHQIDLGIFAIYNFNGGLVSESAVELGNYNYDVVDSIVLNITHHLMLLPKVKFSEINTIISHPQVLKQCKQTLKSKYSKLELKSGEGELIDTAKAAEALVQNKLPKTTGILGPKILSEIYSLKIVDRNLQDSENNHTTFLIVKNKGREVR